MHHFKLYLNSLELTISRKNFMVIHKINVKKTCVQNSRILISNSVRKLIKIPNKENTRLRTWSPYTISSPSLRSISACAPLCLLIILLQLAFVFKIPEPVMWSAWQCVFTAYEQNKGFN